MADEAAIHHHTKEIDFGTEDKRFLRGVLVIQAGTRAAVKFGQITAPGQKLMRACHTCGLNGHIAKDCPDKHKAQTCNNCSEPGHHKAECPSVYCSNCRAVGHIARNCTEAPTCHTCRQPGHQSRRCPQRGRGRKTPSTTTEPCTNCGSAEHVLADCMAGSPPPPPATATKTLGEVTVEEPVEKSVEVPAEVAAEVPAEEKPLEPPKGIDESPPNGGVIVKMQSVLSPDHISSIGFILEGHFPSTEAHIKDGYEHKAAQVYFTGANFQLETTRFSAAVIHPTDKAFTDHVSADQVAVVERYVGEDVVLVHLSMRVSTTALRNVAGEDLGRPLFGLSMFCDASFGSLQADFKAMQDILSGDDIVHVDFFAVRSAEEVARLTEVHAAMMAQHAASPLSKWWKGGRINPQKGQEIQAEDRPSGFKVGKRLSFMSWEEYVTIAYHNLTHELEAMEAKGYSLTCLRLATFPGGGQHLYYGHLDAPPDTHFREGASVSLKLMGPDANEEEDWTFKVVESFGWSHAAQYTGYAFRPRFGSGFYREPELVDGVHTVDSTSHCTSEQMFEAMAALPGIKCYVRENQPRVGVKRAINTLNHLHLGGDSFRRERQLLLANDLRHLPAVDYFGQLRDIVDDANIQKELHRMREQLGPEQQVVVDALRAMKGGVLLVQGPGGVGKTEILVLLCRLQYRMRCLYGDDGKDKALRGLWVISSINKQLDDLASKIYKACELEREHLGVQGKPVVVIRRHMGATEKHVYRRQAEEQRAAATKEQRPLYYDENEADEAEAKADFPSQLGRTDIPAAMWDLITAVRMQGPFVEGESSQGSFDKRLQLEHLSEGRWILRRAGFPDEGAQQPHEIAAAPARYERFRALLESIGKGLEMGADDYDALTLTANSIVKELAELAVAICMTPDVTSQTRAHTLQQPFAVLHDEAGKAPEMGTVAALIFSRPYVSGNGPLQITPDSHVPHILFGDIHQPPPVLGRDSQSHPFGQQNSVSVFQRWVLAGMQTVWLWEQHRSNQCIIDLINHTHPRGRMRVSAGVEARPASLTATECAKEIFNSDRRVIFMTLRGTTEVLHTTKSRYNDTFIVPAMAAACKVMLRVRDKTKRGFLGKDIGIIAAYVAQVATYRHIVNLYRDWLMQQPEDSDQFWLANQLSDIEIFTVDKMQGAQKQCIFHCTTVSDSLGFTQEATRQLLANGRACSLLVIIGDPIGVEASFEGKGKGNPYHATAYYKAWYWCAKNKSVVNLSMNNGRTDDWQLPSDFAVLDHLKAFHREKSNPNDAIQFDEKAVYGTVALGGEDEGEGEGGFSVEDGGGFGGEKDGGFGGENDGGFSGGCDKPKDGFGTNGLATYQW